jgi:hypothetical protein
MASGPAFLTTDWECDCETCEVGDGVPCEVDCREGSELGEGERREGRELCDEVEGDCGVECCGAECGCERGDEVCVMGEVVTSVRGWGAFD